MTNFYKVDGYEGVAWRPAAESDRAPLRDADDSVWLVMVGDDRVFVFDVEDVHPLDSDMFCLECGQIGCTHDGRERL